MKNTKILKRNLKSYKILIIGAGQLGSRYLQGIVQLPDCHIYVVDPSEESLQKASERLKGLKHLYKNLYYFKTIRELPPRIDLAIISTTAKHRPEIVNQLSQKVDVNFWILEKVLAQSIKGLHIIDNSIINNAWINTPRRLMQFHKEIKTKLQGIKEDIFSITVDNINGLACNSIHFIDLFSWYLDTKITSIDSSKLYDWHDSKRSGYKEVYGDMTIKIGNKIDLTLKSNKIKDSYPIIKIITKEGIVLINELEGEANFFNHEYIKGRLDYMSELTPSLVKTILQKGKCLLPDLKESLYQHNILIKSLLDNYNNSNRFNIDNVPIT